MSSSASESVASTVPATVWFSSASNVADELKDGAALASSSSSMIVPLAVASEMAAFDGFDSVTVKVSSPSMSVSSVVWTLNVFVVSPGWKVSVVDVFAVKSVPEVAVSPVSTDVA